MGLDSGTRKTTLRSGDSHNGLYRKELRRHCFCQRQSKGFKLVRAPQARATTRSLRSNYGNVHTIE